MHKLILYVLITMGLIGQVLITKNKRSGYLLWIIADIAWAVFNFSQYKVVGAMEQGILWSVYFVISLWGFIIFKKDRQ
jgi:nicotinamide riboside transporter PnuC